jgi:hypothetical protein
MSNTKAVPQLKLSGEWGCEADRSVETCDGLSSVSHLHRVEVIFEFKEKGKMIGRGLEYAASRSGIQRRGELMEGQK